MEDFALLVSATPTYPYPSGRMLRGTILFGALYFLAGNWFLRAVFLVVLVGIAASRVYFGQHWASESWVERYWAPLRFCGRLVERRI
ncbi:MAG TPA: phosphatase PAP2 family protein [Rubrobacteraceae bacterium]|nr:phosphatase PAP2 family protein [Rubrobacteraceae bacterium]